MTTIELVDRLLKGDRRAVAKLITIIENEEEPNATKALSLLYPHTGHAHVIGVTGPPGAGKSTLVHKLTKALREKNKSVGIIAVDPSSPFTGGALLGDRIRMQELSTDKGVFIRSMGTRGYLGGLAKATNRVIKVLDAYGMDFILVETVGAGQSEVDIVKSAHTSIVVEMPGLGDDIQAIKAGILEIADIFVVNKADRDGADRTVLDLNMMLDLNESSHSKDEWRPPILKTIARDNVGVAEVVEYILEHMKYLRDSGKFEAVMKERTSREFLEIVKDNLSKYILERAIDKGEFETLVEKIVARQIDPYTAADKILEPFSKLGEEPE